MNRLIYCLIIITYFPTLTLAQDNTFNLAGLKAFEVTVKIDDLFLKEFVRWSDRSLKGDLERDLKWSKVKVLGTFDDFVESEHGKLVTEINAVVFDPESNNIKYNIVVKVFEEIALPRLKKGEYCSAITWEKTLTGIALFNDEGWELVKKKFNEATDKFIKDYRKDNRWR